MEDNKLIAEFMVSLTEPDSDGTPIFEGPNGKIRWTKEVQKNSESKSKYHKSWDWLMPVVEKINIFKDFKVVIHFNFTYIFKVGKNSETLFKIENENMLQRTYEAVVSFIKWYNENK